MNKLTLPALRKLINETINEIDLEERADEGHHGSKDETHDVDEDMDEDEDMHEADKEVTVGQMEEDDDAKEEGEKHLEESTQLNRWRKLAGILKS